MRIEPSSPSAPSPQPIEVDQFYSAVDRFVNERVRSEDSYDHLEPHVREEIRDYITLRKELSKAKTNETITTFMIQTMVQAIGSISRILSRG
jgi:predicted metal-dependent hydrolase